MDLTAAEPSFMDASAATPQDWPALQGWLASRGQALDLSFPPRQFAGGLGNLNYRVRVDGEDRVLRRPPAGELPAGANDMRREFGILDRLWEAFPLAPRAFAFCGDPAVLGAPFLLMEYRPGLVIGADWPTHLHADRRGPLGELMVDLLAALHAVDTDAIGLQALGRPEGMLARMVEGWHRRAHAAWDEAPPALAQELVSWLRANVERVPPQRTCLLHSDFKLDNVILLPGAESAQAVIDWDMGTRGDPLVDLATLLSYWTQAGDPEPLQALQQMPTALPGFPTRADVMQRYARTSGIDLSGFQVYRVLAMFKLAVVFRQLHQRHARGQVRQARYAGFGALADGLLAVAQQCRENPDF